MPHIVILDNNGVEIGRVEHPDGGGGTGRIEEPDHEAVILTLNRKYLHDLMCDAIKHCKPDKDKH